MVIVLDIPALDILLVLLDVLDSTLYPLLLYLLLVGRVAGGRGVWVGWGILAVVGNLGV